MWLETLEIAAQTLDSVEFSWGNYAEVGMQFYQDKKNCVKVHTNN